MTDLGEPLSDRELEVLECVSGGAANKEVALKLDISENTVKVHLRNIYTKLGVSSRTEATTVAFREGLITLEDETTDLTSPLRTESAESPALEALAVQPLSTLESEDGAADRIQAEPRGRRNRLVSLGLLVLATVVLVAGLIGLQAASERAAPAPAPFEEEAIGETRWRVSRSLPTGLAGMAVATVGLNVYEIGGETAGGITDAVNVYNTVEHTWQTANPKPTPVADATAAVLFGEIYVPGGRLASGQPTNTVEAYSPANDAWRPVAALPRPIAGSLTLSDGSFLYLFGGWDGQQYLDNAYVYDAGADRWRPLPPMSQARAFAAGGVVTGKIYAVGGTDGRDSLPLCEFFDTVAEEWATCPGMLLPRAGAGAAVLVNKLYVIGGEASGEVEVAFSEVYDPNTRTWQLVNTPMLEETPAWAHLGVAQVETRIYALGGHRGGEPVADNFVYAPFVYQTFIPAASADGDN